MHPSTPQGKQLCQREISIGSIPTSENELVERLRKLIDLRTGIIQETKKYLLTIVLVSILTTFSTRVARNH